MKKLMVLAALVLTNFLACANAYVPYSYSKYCVSVPKFCGGLTFGIYGLYWRPGIPHLDYALSWDTLNALGFPSFAAGADVISVNPSYNWSFRANIGYVFPCSGYDIITTYTDYDHDFKEFIGNSSPGFALAMTLAQGDINSLTLGFPNPIALTFPLNGFTAIIDSSEQPLEFAQARTTANYQAWDVELGKSISVGCDIRLRWFGGLRYAELDHRLEVDYFSDDSDIFPNTPTTGSNFVVDFDAELTVNQKNNFHGVGPRFGLGANYYLSAFDWSGWCDCPGWFGISAEISSAILIGEMSSSLREVFNRNLTATVVPVASPTTGLTEVQTFSDSQVVGFHNPELTRVIPNLEGKLAINYNYIFRRSRTKLTVEAGWAITHYWNAVERTTALTDMPEFRIRQILDASFEGPYLGLQVNI